MAAADGAVVGAPDGVVGRSISLRQLFVVDPINPQHRQIRPGSRGPSSRRYVATRAADAADRLRNRATIAKVYFCGRPKLRSDAVLCVERPSGAQQGMWRSPSRAVRSSGQTWRSALLAHRRLHDCPRLITGPHEIDRGADTTTSPPACQAPVGSKVGSTRKPDLEKKKP